MTTTTPPSAVQVDDAVYTLALHLLVLDCAERGEHVTIDAATRIARIARLRGLHPTSDVLWLGFELEGTMIQPLDRDTIRVNEDLVRQDVYGALDLRWLRDAIRRRPGLPLDGSSREGCEQELLRKAGGK